MSKSDNRKNFPKMTKVIDSFKKQFPELKVIYVCENGKEIGKK